MTETIDTPTLPATSVTASVAGLSGTATEAAIAARRDIFEKTEAAEIAVLTPAEAGGLSHDLRHALAARIAALHGADDQAARYRAGVKEATLAALADVGTTAPDPRLAAMLRFTDAVSTKPAGITAQDVRDLQVAGISDADIVRLAELNAFLAYQLRLIAGLRLMVEAAR